MSMLSSLLSIATGPAIIYMFAGVLLGLIFGAIPGLTATLAVVILIPITYTMDVTVGMSMLIGAYVGGMSGGFVSAIMLNMPGTPSSVATCFDGFPLAQQGKASKAMGAGMIANLFGTLFGWLCLLLVGPALTRVALSFGAFETSAALLFGFTAVVSLSGSNPFKGLLCALLGLTLCLIGYDTVTGMPRATYDLKLLETGFSQMPVLIGLFVCSEVFSQVEEIAQKFIVPKQKMIKGVDMTFKDFVSYLPNLVRSSAIGVAIGILPGIGGAFANFVTYDQARKADKHPETFGKGNINGVIAAEAGNKGTIGGALVPFVALGIPGDIVTAVLLGGLMIKGITPGPLFASEHPETVNAIYNSVLLASLLVFVFMIFVGIRLFPYCLRIPKHVLLPIVLIFALVGTYNLNFSTADVWVAALFGLVGYLMDKIRMPKTPMIITMILGKSFENYLRTAMTLSGGSLLPFLTRPFALIFILATVATLLVPVAAERRKAKKEAAVVQKVK